MCFGNVFDGLLRRCAGELSHACRRAAIQPRHNKALQPAAYSSGRKLPPLPAAAEFGRSAACVRLDGKPEVVY
jgi:hypothetical protein